MRKDEYAHKGYKGGPNSVSKNHISFRCKKRTLLFVFALAVDRLVTIGRRTAQFRFGLLMRCLFLGSSPFASLDS